MKKEEKKEQDCKELQVSVACERVEIPIVKQLEENSKVGFYAESRKIAFQNPLDADYLPLVRLRCESKTGEGADDVLTPFMPVETLTYMLQGALYMHPALIKVIADRQANAPAPENVNSNKE